MTIIRSNEFCGASSSSSAAAQPTRGGMERASSMEEWRTQVWRNESSIRRDRMQQAREAALQTAQAFQQAAFVHHDWLVSQQHQKQQQQQRQKQDQQCTHGSPNRMQPRKRKIQSRPSTPQRSTCDPLPTLNTDIMNSNKKNRNAHSLTTKQLLRRTQRMTQDCYQCTICAALFSSFDEAMIHEVHCLHYLIQCTTTHSINPCQHHHEQQIQPQGHSFHHDPVDLVLQDNNCIIEEEESTKDDDDYPSSQHTVTVDNTTTATQLSHPSSSLPPLPSCNNNTLNQQIIKEYIVMTEESLIAAVHLAKHIQSGILTKEQLHAERELHLCTRDRWYYQAWNQYRQRILEHDRKGKDVKNKRRSSISSTGNGGGGEASGTTTKRHLSGMATEQTLLGENSNNGTSKRKGQRRHKLHLGQVWNQLSERLSNAYYLIKEGEENVDIDCFPQDSNNNLGGGTKTRDGKSTNISSHRNWHRNVVASSKPHLRGPGISHTNETLYLNIIVKPSVQFVNNELERIAQQFWVKKYARQRAIANNGTSLTRSPSLQQQSEELEPERNHFQKLKAMAQGHAVKLAKLALSPNPQLIAVQLSNDLHRLLTPQLQQCGVEIETEIEYRKGPFFILSINVLSIDWILVMKYFHTIIKRRRDIAWKSKTHHGEPSAKIGRTWKFLFAMSMIFQLTALEAFEQLLAWFHRLHWMISVPLCSLLYNFACRRTLKRLIITSVTDDFFQYIEAKGMEMDLNIKQAHYQAAFMLEAMRQLRRDELDKQRKEKRSAQDEEEQEEDLRGPLLGPLIELDKEKDVVVPEGFVVPENLETVNLEVDLPVGFLRARLAMLTNSDFMIQAVWTDALNYSEIKCGEWDNFDENIGQTENVDCNEGNFIGARKESQYLMPKSAFVSANVAYEECELIAYNNYCFAMKRRTRNPDVPYGKTFVACTQIVVTNTGNNSCRMVCSVEAEFPNGPPMVARQIKSGMRAGTTEVFVKMGETFCKYADLMHD